MPVVRTSQRRSKRTRADPRAGQRGSVTAETAVVLPVLLIVLLACIWVLAAVGTQLRCVDAARVTARVAARGDTDAVARSAGQAAAPPGAVIVISTRGEQVHVEVRAQVRPVPALSALPALPVQGRAVALVEPSSGPAGLSAG